MTLTPRQADVLGLLARGMSARRAAQLLGVSEQTAKWHARNARRQLGARNTAHAVAVALYEGLIVP